MFKQVRTKFRSENKPKGSWINKLSFVALGWGLICDLSGLNFDLVTWSIIPAYFHKYKIIDLPGGRSIKTHSHLGYRVKGKLIEPDIFHQP